MKVVRHTLFWIGILVILTIVFGHSYQTYAESFYFVSMLLPVVVGTTYFFNYFLLPHYLFQQKYLKFFLYSFYLLIISLNLEMYVVTAVFILLAEYKYAAMNPITTDIFVLTITLYLVVLGLAFIRLVRFYFQNQNALKTVEIELKKSAQKNLIVTENRRNKQIPLDSIDYLESMGDYVKIHSNKEKPTITKESISGLSDRLPSNFIRIHRSFIVNKNKVSAFGRELVSLQETELPVGRSYKKKALALLGEHIPNIISK